MSTVVVKWLQYPILPFLGLELFRTFHKIPTDLVRQVETSINELEGPYVYKGTGIDLVVTYDRQALSWELFADLRVPNGTGMK